ncbi:MAG: DUF748 domain-containing protein [Sulfuricella sp.]|nr:DUF748 domain-containing protein [Sulfuricella sp.]
MKRLALILLAMVIMLAAAAMLAFPYAVKALKGQVEHALGAESEVGEIVVGWSTIEVRNVRIHAPKDWPAEDTLRARRIVIEPDLRGLLSAQVRIKRIAVEDGYLSLLRTRDGRLRVLPSLLGKPAESSTPPPSIAIGTVELKPCAIEFYDASIRQAPHKLRLEQINATLDDLNLPDLKSKTRLKLEGVVKGVRQDGSVLTQGWIELASRDSEIDIRLRGVDLIALQPYLIKTAETGVKRGTLDLDLKSAVHDNRLRAPGKLTLSHLELSSGSGFMGMPRQAVVSALQNHQDQITIQFTLEGDINDPRFSLNESLAKRLGASLAQSLGIDIEGLSRGIGNAAQGIGGAIRKLLK